MEPVDKIWQAPTQMRFYSGKSAVTSPAYTHMDSFSAGQCPWAVTGEGGQILRAAVAVRAAYTDRNMMK